MKNIPITKFISHAGYGSRREAEELVRDGKVSVDGEIAQLGAEVTGQEHITVENYTPKETMTWAYYKPSGIVTMHAQNNDQEIKDVLDLPSGVVPVGRLDKDSEGLILLSNDSSLPQDILGSGIEKEYYVEVDKQITHGFLVNMRNGVKIKIPTKKGSRWYTTKKTKVRRVGKYAFEIILTEGKNRQIRRMCAALGYGVTMLKRFRIGDVELGKMKPGQYRNITK